MEKSFLSFEKANFNDLPSIEVANENVQLTDKLNQALAVLGPIFLKHNMFNSWGISLLHKHFVINDHEIPIQNVEIENNRKLFVTIPRAIKIDNEIYPAVYKLEDFGNLIPLEFSTDTSALIANNELKNNPEFVQEFYSTLVENDLIDYFGLIYGKTFNTSFELVEFNYEERISILKEVPANEVNEMKLIQTSWFFSAEAPDGKCKSKCMSYCSKSGENHDHGHTAYHDPNG